MGNDWRCPGCNAPNSGPEGTRCWNCGRDAEQVALAKLQHIDSTESHDPEDLELESNLGTLGLVARSYTVVGLPEGDEGYDPVTIQARGGDRWAVCWSGSCLSKKHRSFVYESLPSNRTDKYLADTRFDSPKEALEALVAAINARKSGKRDMLFQQLGVGTRFPHALMDERFRARWETVEEASDGRPG